MQKARITANIIPEGLVRVNRVEKSPLCAYNEPVGPRGDCPEPPGQWRPIPVSERLWFATIGRPAFRPVASAGHREIFFLVERRDDVGVELTRRLLKGLIAGNPANYGGLGEWRYCHDCSEPFFARASEPDAGHASHGWSVLPALNPEGQERLIDLFRDFILRAFSPQRQVELEAFARRHGWDLAYELQDGGGALTSQEVSRWREAVEVELERLVGEAETMITGGSNA
jgi:hypothetical protein